MESYMDILQDHYSILIHIHVITYFSPRSILLCRPEVTEAELVIECEHR